MNGPTLLFNGIPFPNTNQIIIQYNKKSKHLHLELEYDTEQYDEVNDFLKTIMSMKTVVISYSTLDQIPVTVMKPELSIDEESESGKGMIKFNLNETDLFV